MRVESNNKKETTIKSDNIVIHDVHILDSSGSMLGSKYNNALVGINKDILASKETSANNPNIISTMTIVEFSHKIKTHIFMQPIEKVNIFTSNNMEGMTSLNQAIGETIEKLLSAKGASGKVLIKIFTDGIENGSEGIYKDNYVLADLIDKVQKENNFTITFVGTQTDVNKVIDNLHIPASNTLVHQNTADSIAKAYNDTVFARKSYVNRSIKGQDVTASFYSKELK